MIVACILFWQKYIQRNVLFSNMTQVYGMFLLFTVILVHVLKAFRLYLILYGTDIGFGEYIKIYCKTTPVSVLFPWKLGELFRMYCHGKRQNNLLKGVVVILLDRFMDTIALVMMILFVCLITGGKVAPIVYFFVICLCFILMLYMIFPGIHKFWKKHILCAKATKNGLSMLKMLDTMEKVYQEIKTVSRGRGMILFCLSVLAWGTEIGSIALKYGAMKEFELSSVVSTYLLAAINGNSFVELEQFIFMSVLLMICVYGMMKVIETVKRVRNK